MTLWSCFQQTQGLTALLFGDSKQKAQGACHARLSLTHGSFGHKLEDPGLLKIGEGRGPWLPVSKKVDITLVPKVQRETLRISAPSCFRTLFLGAKHEDSPTEVIKHLAAMTGSPTSEFFGGRWSFEEKKEGKQLIVFLRLKPALIATLVGLSGNSGLFMTHIKPKGTSDLTPFWIARQPKENHETYHRRVLQLQLERKQPMHFSVWTGDNLGFPKCNTDHKPEKARLHVVQGVPRAWGYDDHQSFLEKQQWTEISALSKRRSAWSFLAKAPEEPTARASWQYDIQDADTTSWSITIQVAVRSQNGPQSLTGSFAIPSRQNIRATLARLQSDLGQLRDQTKNSNLMSWRTKLQSCSSHVSKFLRSKEWSMCSGVIRTDGTVTENWHEGSEAIKAFWESFWSDLRRSIPSFSQREAALLHGVPAPVQAVDIPFPTGLELQATAQDSHGAAGPDNWTAQELKYLPLDVFNTVAELFRAFATARDVPKQLRQSRMVCLPKEGKVHDYSIKAGDARPISVMSVRWRLWSSSVCRSTSLRSWLRSVLLANVGGVSREDIYENIIEIFDNFHKHGFMLTMDYSKAFDCLDSNLSCSLLRAPWPLDLIHLLEATWRHQERFVQWDHHTHSST